jgi:dynein heavy chain
MYLDEQPEVPYVTLNYIISEINYGGRVTDDKDVRLITALLR